MRPPRLSVGLPVRNGQRYLAAALGSLMGQTFSDFELIISDNASDDRTREICRAFAATDSRIRYLRFEENVGAARNYNRVFHEGSGEYFKWAAHDDVCAPQFLEKCIQVLDDDPTAVLCHSVSGRIDSDGRSCGVYPNDGPFEADQPHRRFRQIITIDHFCIPIFGVVRREVMQRTPLHGSYVGADRNLLAEYGLMGKLRLVPECLFFRRDHPDASIAKYVDERERLAWFDPRLTGCRSFPTWRRFREYRAALRRVPLPAVEKARCYLQLARWLASRHHSGRRNASLLIAEMGHGVRTCSRRSVTRAI